MTESTVDSEGRQPAALALTCPYCVAAGLIGEIAPVLEYTASYSEHRDWTGTECETCNAEWNTDGTPRRGPHEATLAWAIRAKQKTAQMDNHMDSDMDSQMDNGSTVEETR